VGYHRKHHLSLAPKECPKSTTKTTKSIRWGKGTSGNPYQIATAEQLNEIRNYLDKHFILIADIDLDVYPYNTDKGWIPIGNSTTKFTGNVNGNGYTIDGLFINKSTTNYVGLFGYTDEATIESIGLTNVDVTGKNNVGGLAGYNDEGSSIKDSYATGSVDGTDNVVGGLAGYNDEDYTIIRRHATGSVAGTAYVGGLVGLNGDNSNTNDTDATRPTRRTVNVHFFEVFTLTSITYR